MERKGESFLGFVFFLVMNFTVIAFSGDRTGQVGYKGNPWHEMYVCNPADGTAASFCPTCTVHYPVPQVN